MNYTHILTDLAVKVMLAINVMAAFSRFLSLATGWR